MNNYEKINEFLLFWRDIVKENPNLRLTNDMVYNKLIKMNVNKADLSINLQTNYYNENNNKQSTFDEWINYYKKNSNINVFCDPNWKYFCQFKSNQDIINFTNHIKIYIPLDYKHIENGAKMIFDFLAYNNIPHCSKIAKEIRFDDIVIRLINPKDADKLIQFVTNNAYIQQGLIQPNPFAIQKNGLALACDGRISYNNTITNLITYYIKKCKYLNQLDHVNIYDFYNFILNVYQNEDLLKTIFPIADENLIKNYKQVLELILSVQHPSFTYEAYIEHYKRSNEKQNNNKEDILKKAIITTTIKYDDQQSTVALIQVIKNKNYTYFTNDNNARTELLSLTPYDIKNIIINSLNINENTFNYNINLVCEKYILKTLQENECKTQMNTYN